MKRKTTPDWGGNHVVLVFQRGDKRYKNVIYTNSYIGKSY